MELPWDRETLLDFATLHHFESHDALEIPDQFSSPCCYGRGKTLEDIVLPRMPKIFQEEDFGTVDISFVKKQWYEILRDNGLGSRHSMPGCGRGRMLQDHHISLRDEKIEDCEMSTVDNKQPAMHPLPSHLNSHTPSYSSHKKSDLFQDADDSLLFCARLPKQADLGHESDQEFQSLSETAGTNKKDIQNCLVEESKCTHGDEEKSSAKFSWHTMDQDELEQDITDLTQAQDKQQNQVSADAELTHAYTSLTDFSVETDSVDGVRPIGKAYSQSNDSSEIKTDVNSDSTSMLNNLLLSTNKSKNTDLLCMNELYLDNVDDMSSVDAKVKQSLNEVIESGDQTTESKNRGQRQENLNPSFCNDDCPTEIRSCSARTKTSKKVKKKMQSGWKLSGPTVVHVENVPKNHGEELTNCVSSFGKVFEVEKKAKTGTYAWRYRFDNVDTCDYVVECLEGAQLFEGYTAPLQCYRLEENDADGTALGNKCHQDMNS